MAVAALRFITEGEYLAAETVSEEKHEYLRGRVFEMAGTEPEHALISSNVACELSNLTDAGPCRVYSCGLRIRVRFSGLNTYADATLVCGELKRTEQRPQAATNPALLVEVLSDSTREYDRGEKWRHYQTIESLDDYVLVWQDRPRVEHYARQSDDAWTYRLVEGLEARLRLDSLGGELALAEVYRGVAFPEAPPLR